MSAAKVEIPVVPKVSWYTILISSVVYWRTSTIDAFSVDVFSLNINCSPLIKAPVVCDTASSLTPVAFAFFARYPIAPLAKPLILVPATLSPAFVKTLHFKIVNVWISYKCKSHSVVVPEYGASETPNEYTLASPICIPLVPAVVAPLLWLYSWTTFVFVPPILTKGDPITWLSFTKLPILNGIDATFIVFVSLGFSTSTTVVPGKYTSNPLTYALPADNL